MSKINKKRIVESAKIFDNIKVGKKDMGIKRRLNSSNVLVKKNYKLMKGVSYGNDLNYQLYMAYLDKFREEEEFDLNENLKEKNKNEFYNDLNMKELLSKKISFSEFSNKFKINPFLLEYLDYYDIQKINRKETEKYLQAENAKMKKLLLMKNKDNNSDNIEEEKSNLFKNSNNNNNNKTENNLDGKYKDIYEKLINNNYVKQKCYNNENNKKIYLSGIDFNLINKISGETLKVTKKIQHLKYIKELHKEKERIYKKITKIMNDPKSKNINYNMNDLLDEFTIFHGIEPKYIRKLNKLKTNLNNDIDEDIHKKKRKLSKTIYHTNPSYFIYIPNSAKYKHISFQKDCLFNKELESNKKTKKKHTISLRKNNNKYSVNFLNNIDNINNINNLLKTRKNYFKNGDVYFLSTQDNLKTKSNKIIKDLKEIKSLLKQDRDYTSKTIDKANAKYHQNQKIRQDQKLMESVMHDDRKKLLKLKEIQKKRRNKKINEKNNVFSTLKQINECYEKDKKSYSEMNFQFKRLLNALCKSERKENKEYNKILKNNYHLKLENEEEDNNIKTIKENIDNKQCLVSALNAKIQKKCLEINDIINESQKKNEISLFKCLNK